MSDEILDKINSEKQKEDFWKTILLGSAKWSISMLIIGAYIYCEIKQNIRAGELGVLVGGIVAYYFKGIQNKN